MNPQIIRLHVKINAEIFSRYRESFSLFSGETKVHENRNLWKLGSFSGNPTTNFTIMYSKQKTLSWSSYLVTLHINDASSFSAENNGHVIDIVYYLQNYPGGWENGEFREKMDIKECINPPPYHKNSADDLFRGPFWTYR